jgi:membrane protease YdiL (CAAX protease family)
MQDESENTPQNAPETPSLEVVPPELTVPARERVPFWGYTDLFLVLGLLFGFSVIVVVMIGLLAIPYPSLRTDQTALALPVQIAFYGCLYLSFRMVLSLRYRKPVFWSLGWRRARINLVWMGAGGIVLAFVLSALGDLFKTPKITLPFDKLTNTPASLTFFAIVAIVLAPFFEELFFRGFVQPLLSRTFGTVAGVLITAVFFGALHGFEYSWVWQYALFISLAGAVFGFLRARTNSIVPSTVMHGCFNAVSVVALAFGKNI